MKITDVAYTAGLFDGEGSVCLNRPTGIKGKRGFRYPSVQLPSTTYALLAWMLTIFGGNVYAKRTRNKNASPSWMWCLKRDKAIDFLRLILPYLKEPEKIRRSELIVNDYKRLTPSNGYYTKEMRESKARFESDFYSIKDGRSKTKK